MARRPKPADRPGLDALLASAARDARLLAEAGFEGIVVERYRTQGERIEREPIVKIARIDPLRVEAIAPAASYGRIQVGQVGAVTPQLKQFGSLKATVVLVDKVVDAASNSFRVRLSLPNPGQDIPSGLRCTVEVPPAPAGATPR